MKNQRKNLSKRSSKEIAKEAECRAKLRGDPKVQALIANAEPKRASEQIMKIRQGLDDWRECPSLLDSRANVTLILEEYAKKWKWQSQDCDITITWGSPIQIEKCYLMQMEAGGKAIPILCYGIKRKVGLIDMDAPLLIGESDFERLGWKLSRSETSKGEERENKVAVTDSPGENQMETRFWENDIMGAGTIPTEDEMPRTLEFNPIVEDVDKSKWPAGLLREVERLPRAFSEKDLAKPAKLGTIEFEFSKDIPEQIPPLYVPKMHAEREKLVETRLQSLIDSGMKKEHLHMDQLGLLWPSLISLVNLEIVLTIVGSTNLF
jgi:hypothetical protein